MKWNHILIEGYCARNWDWISKHSKYLYTLDTTKDDMFDNPEKILNSQYDPSVKKGKRPKYCKKRICMGCIKCKHLAYSECDDEFIQKFKDMAREYFKE